ncbi:MAG: hypothetical protein JSU85_08555 [Candidatus Zixiibacteriota bacterium]|nr:MAG: hypothetical protein JSU85_08555 [candidate division Zixibacteria bacterium]
MKKICYPAITLPVIIIIFSATSVLAQWPANPDSNMVLCDRGGDQAVPKIAAASDGGCYITWFDVSSGNYAVYMQRLNGNGEIQWAPGGMLISNNPQNSWVTDYDLTVDNEDHAVVVFNDIRNGGDMDIYAYRISPAGVFVWGDNGLTLSDNADRGDMNAVVTITSSGNFVFAWVDDSMMVHLRKVNSTGTDMWSPHTITLTSTYGLALPRVAAAENDGVILSCLQKIGPNFLDPYCLYAHKFDSLGVAQWDPNGVAVNSTGGLAAWMKHNLTADGAGGAYSSWHDTRYVQFHVYVQHILSDGNTAWVTDGVLISLDALEMQMDPALVHFPSSNDLLIFYRATDLAEDRIGVSGQKIDFRGDLQWGESGNAIVPMGSEDRSHISAQAQPDGAIVVYKELPVSTRQESYIKAIRVDMDGNLVWTTSPVEMCSFLSEKGRIPTTVNDSGTVIAAWDDARADSEGDMYLQQIFQDGTLGPPPIGRCCYNDSQDCVDTTEDACHDLAGYWAEGLNCTDDPCPTGTCDYAVGDVNGSSNYNGLDITYGVAYFKGGSAPLCADCPVGDCNTWHYCGDVNGSCGYNGLDITYGVAYFKGGPGPIFCVDCPPTE